MVGALHLASYGFIWLHLAAPGSTWLHLAAPGCTRLLQVAPGWALCLPAWPAIALPAACGPSAPSVARGLSRLHDNCSSTGISDGTLSHLCRPQFKTSSLTYSKKVDELVVQKVSWSSPRNPAALQLETLGTSDSIHPSCIHCCTCSL